jgi:hypothetical protein
MPPRYAYWTIIAGGLPTAFRTTEREELLPTFRRIKQKHPDAELKYFARGRLWSSPDEARVEAEARRAAAAERHGTRGGPSRGRDWRPGGEHQDPRQKFKDAKKVRNQDRRQERFDRRHKSDAAPPPGGARTGRPPVPGNRPWNDRGPRTSKPPASGDRPWRDRAPRTGKPPASGDRPWNDRGPRTSKPGAPHKPEWRKTEDRRKPDARGSYGAPKASGARKPVPRPRSSGPSSKPTGRAPGPPQRDRNQRGPAKDRRRH